MVFAQLAFLDEGLVDAEEPDVVITVLNERYLIRTPNDGPSRSLDRVLQSSRRTRGYARRCHSGRNLLLGDGTAWRWSWIRASLTLI